MGVRVEAQGKGVTEVVIEAGKSSRNGRSVIELGGEGFNVSIKRGRTRIDTVPVVGIHNENKTLSILIVMSPQWANFVLKNWRVFR